MRRYAPIFLAGFLALGPGCTGEAPPRLVNYAHLDHLTETVTVRGNPASIVHIYANYPDYHWVDAKESGPEGIACVDDAARAAVVALRDFELNHGRASLDRARALLQFVLSMQAADGRFNNFIFADGSVNADGKTSFTSFGWWAARGIWALGYGCTIFGPNDREFARRLEAAVERSLPRVHDLVARYDTTSAASGFTSPTWLMYESGADATSELLLGLAQYYRTHPSAGLREDMQKIARGLMVMQEGDALTFPYGVHRSWGSLWHLWGNSQTQALALTGNILGDSSMIASARREADGFYPRLLTSGLFNEMDLARPGDRKEFGQIAYGIRPMALGFLRLFDATGDRTYLRMAGLAASWFFGNNPAGAVMYDSASGRCFDGIRSPSEINRNSGAESTIEALMTLVDIEAYPEASRYLTYRRVRSTPTEAVFASPRGEQLVLRFDPIHGTFIFE
jgi:hypothetical protein